MIKASVLVNLPPYTTATWFMASRHSLAARTLLPSTLRSASQSNLIAASSLGKCPRVLMIFRSCICRLSMALVVYMIRRTAGGKAKNGIT